MTTGKKLNFRKTMEKNIQFCKKLKITFATSPFSVEAVKIMRNLVAEIGK